MNRQASFNNSTKWNVVVRDNGTIREIGVTARSMEWSGEDVLFFNADRELVFVARDFIYIGFSEDQPSPAS